MKIENQIVLNVVKIAVMYCHKQYFRKQLTEEEKQLGEKANQLRIENYANLREKGNRIWHGKLAGQLLADVLEQDFMEAEIQEDRDGTDN